jgi:insertion element IS1 protein InsB
MVMTHVLCPHCDSKDVVKRGKTANGKQRYLCNNEACSASSFILDYSYNGYLPEVKDKIIEMAMNGSGIRDTSRVLKVSQTTDINEIKKRVVPSIH